MHLTSKLSVTAVCAILLVGCTYRGVAEFTAYRQSYGAAAEVGNSILDRLAVSERIIYETAYPFDPKLTNFDPANARYYVEAVDPPLTAAYRRTITAVAEYNDGLYGLASGEEAAALAAKITRLSAIGAGAATDLAALAAVGPTSGGAAAVATATSINTILTGLEPLTAGVIAFEYRRQFRRKLIEAAPTIREALEEARVSASTAFDGLQLAILSRADNDQTRVPPGTLTEAESEQIRRDFELLATWVVLLQSASAAFEVAVSAIEEDAGAGTFDGVLLASEQLSEALAAARRKLAGGD